MANLLFFAAWEDFCAVLDCLYSETDCRLYEAYSLFDHELREFRSVAAIDAAFSAIQRDGGQVFLQAWFPAAGGEVRVKRITLRPGAVSGHSYRFAAEGWGLVQFQFGGLKNAELKGSRIACNSEARARAWEATLADRLGFVSAWNWRELTAAVRKLERQIRRRLLTEKIGPRMVLHGAARLRASGIRLRSVC